MASPRITKATGCVRLKGTNRLLVCAGLLIFTCYFMSELALRSWTLDDSYHGQAPLCGGQHDGSLRFQAMPCAPVRVTPRSYELPPGRELTAQPTEDASWNESQFVSWMAPSEIGVDRAAVQARARPGNPHHPRGRQVTGGGLQVERPPPLGRAFHRPHNKGRPEGAGHGVKALEGTPSKHQGEGVTRPPSSSKRPGVQGALERRFYSRRFTRVNPHDFTVVYNASGVCAQPPYLIIIIPSLPSARDRRNAIRDTWGGVSNSSRWLDIELSYKVKVAFLLGRTESERLRYALQEEYAQFGDIVQEDFLESYRNLSLKTVMGLKWVVKFCSGAQYVMKCDDDMIAHIPMIVDLLTRNSYRRSVVGHVNRGAVVQRQGLWRLSHGEFPFHYFPPYASGSAYILSADVVGALYTTSEYIPLIPIEDVYVTGVLGKMVGVNLVHEDGFTSWNAFSPRTCDLALGRIYTGTKMTSNSLRRMWRRLRSGGLKCNRDAHQLAMRSQY